MYIRKVNVVSTCYASTKQSISVSNIIIQQNFFHIGDGTLFSFLQILNDSQLVVEMIYSNDVFEPNSPTAKLLKSTSCPLLVAWAIF